LAKGRPNLGDRTWEVDLPVRELGHTVQNSQKPFSPRVKAPQFFRVNERKNDLP
jgi:hypothetical protein